MSNDSSKPTPSPEPAPLAPQTASKPDPPVKQPGVPWSPVVAVAYAALVFFVAQLLASIVVIMYAKSRGWGSAVANFWLDHSIAAQFWFVLSAEILTFSAIWWFVVARGVSMRVIGWTRPQWRDGLYLFGGFVVYFFAAAVLMALVASLFPSVNLNQPQDVGFQDAHGSTELLLTFISLVVLPPLVEETVFRGFVFTSLRSKMPWVLAAVLTSGLFAIAHLQAGSGAPLLWAAAIDTFVLSMVLCYLRQKTDSLWPGILLHALKNGLAFLTLFAIGTH